MTTLSLLTELSALIILSLTITIVRKSSPILLVASNILSYQDLNQTLSKDLSILQTHCKDIRNETIIKLIPRNDSFIDGAVQDSTSSFPSTHGFLKGYVTASTPSKNSTFSSFPPTPELILIHLQYYFKTYHLDEQEGGILASINSYIDFKDLIQDDFDFFIGDMKFRESLYQIMAFYSSSLDSFLVYTISNTSQPLIQDLVQDDHLFADKCVVLRYFIKEVELAQVKKMLKPNPNVKVGKSPYSTDECGYIMSLKLVSSEGKGHGAPSSDRGENSEFGHHMFSSQKFKNDPFHHSFNISKYLSRLFSRKQSYSATLYSPQCGTYTSTSLLFTKRESLIRSELDSTFILIVLSLLELYMTIIQIQKLDTIVQQSRLSQTSILLMTSLDFCVGGICFIRCFFDSSTDEATFESLLTLAFVKLIEFACYDMKLVFMIATAQARARINWITKCKYYCCFFFGFYCALILVSEWVGWMVEFFIILLYSFLVPQIIRNVWKNSSRPVFTREFLFGGSLLRFITGVFLWVCVFKSGGYPFYDAHHLNWMRIVSLVILILISSIFIILIQEVRESRVFVPSFFPLPYSFDYHSLDPSILHTSSQTHECAICFNEIRKDWILDPSLTQKHGKKGIRVYELMQTPCGHLFDTTCLEKWIETKLECPVCRSCIPEYC